MKLISNIKNLYKKWRNRRTLKSILKKKGDKDPFIYD
jgi:uncharacterized protein YjiS (DUF1127 family)